MSLNNGEANELVFSRFQAAAKVSKVRHSHDHKDTHRKDSTGSGKKVTRVPNFFHLFIVSIRPCRMKHPLHHLQPHKTL